MNKIGFRIKIDKFKIIISFDKKKRNYIANSNNKNYCTTVEFINVINVIISLLIILKTINILLK